MGLDEFVKPYSENFEYVLQSDIIDFDVSSTFKVLPYYTEDKEISFLTPYTPSIDLQSSLSFIVSKYVYLTPVSDSVFEDLFRNFWKRDIKQVKNTENFESIKVVDKEKEKINSLFLNNSITEIIDLVITRAVNTKASDIHFEPFEDTLKVRFRIDGTLHLVYNFPIVSQQELVSRLKIMASLDIAEKRKPQDGKIVVENSHKVIDIRMSTMPVKFGEKVVLRLLDKSEGVKSLSEIGLMPSQVDLLEKELHKKSGIILLTGPTGSGKTTSLYSFLNYLHNDGVNISTVEDPIEYHFDGMNQTQYNPKVGYTFADAIKTFLRQDPDIIMVGEIRDVETAKYAIQAAQTGHLVFSTLHTNDAPSSITRLIDMGIDPYLISSSINLVLAQRLVKTLCPECKTVKELSFQEQEITGLSGEYSTSSGCPFCNHSGFVGRSAIFESMRMDEELQKIINKEVDTVKIREVALENGFISLQVSAVSRVKEGVTSVGEIIPYFY